MISYAYMWLMRVIGCVVMHACGAQARIPFPRPAEDRKSIKEVIIEMTKAAKAHAATDARTPGGSA